MKKRRKKNYEVFPLSRISSNFVWYVDRASGMRHEQKRILLPTSKLFISLKKSCVPMFKWWIPSYFDYNKLIAKLFSNHKNKSFVICQNPLWWTIRSLAVATFSSFLFFTMCSYHKHHTHKVKINFLLYFHFIILLCWVLKRQCLK